MEENLAVDLPYDVQVLKDFEAQVTQILARISFFNIITTSNDILRQSHFDSIHFKLF